MLTYCSASQRVNARLGPERGVGTYKSKLAVRKLPQMTWFSHCIINVTAALRALPTAGQLMLISDLRDFLDRQEQQILRHERERKIKTSGC
jgi:hypothetical protein